MAAAAAATANPVTTTTTNLNVLGADDDGESTLINTCSATAEPADTPVPLFHQRDPLRKERYRHLRRSGHYTFSVTIANTSGLTTFSTVDVTVQSM